MTQRIPLPILLVLAIILGCCINTVKSQQQFGVAADNRNYPDEGGRRFGKGGGFGGSDVIQREYYEYHPPGADARGRRRAGPFDGILPGILLTVASSALQWYNEGRAVRDARMLAKAQRSVVELGELGELDPLAPLEAENDGRLVHVTGLIITDEGLTDVEHGLHRPHALQLTRKTEAYLWKEHRSESRTRVGERTTKVTVNYRYDKEWTKRPIDSQRFESPSGHFNPHPKHRLGIHTMTVGDARLSNGMHVPPTLVNQMNQRRFRFDDGNRHLESRVFLGNGEDLAPNENAVVISSQGQLYYPNSISPSDLLVVEHRSNSRSSPSTNDSIAVVRSIPHPDVGDVRVSWTEVIAPPEGVSILAQQRGNSLIPWRHDGTGHSIYTLFPGKHTAKSMISKLLGHSKFITRLLRIGGWIGSFLGLNLVLSCLPALVRLLPFGIGRALEPLVFIATSTIAFGASIGLSLAVISVAWLRFRPLFAGVLAFVSGAGFFGPLYYAKWKRSDEVKEMDAKLHQEANS